MRLETAPTEWDQVNWVLSPVGSFPEGSSPCGVLDMAGSVAEWCADSDKEKKIVRGGGWNAIRLQLRCVHREAQPPTYQYYNFGFRCAKDAE